MPGARQLGAQQLGAQQVGAQQVGAQQVGAQQVGAQKNLCQNLLPGQRSTKMSSARLERATHGLKVSKLRLGIYHLVTRYGNS